MTMLLTLLLGAFFTMVELNCENLFDCQHDSLFDDGNFLPEGSYRWTPYRYWRKLQRVGQTIVACGDKPKGQENAVYQCPDLVALVEVENDSVLHDLTRRSILRKAGYRYVMTHSPDRRGIDVALLYAPSSFRLVAHTSFRIKPLPHAKPTRDVLYVKGCTKWVDTLHVFVVHWPSKAGGARATEPYRLRVAQVLKKAVDSILVVNPHAGILIAGDFNADYRSISFNALVKPPLVDISQQAIGNHGAKGTYRYQGKWERLDHIVCNEALRMTLESCWIGDFPFLMEPDEKYGGWKPKRNYLGPIWKDGFSDHLPLVARFAM